MDPSDRVGELSTMAPGTPAGPVALPVLVGRVGREVCALHRRCAALEHRLGAALPEEARSDPSLREALQSLDHLTQATAGLATFLDRLSLVGRTDLVDPRPMTAGLALRAMAERLGAGVDAEPSQLGGAVELF